MTENRRARGLAKMEEVYGWEVTDGDGDFFGMTVEHLFGEVWERDVLSLRDRRLMLIALTVGRGMPDVAELLMDAGLRVGDLAPDDLREIVIFLTHYAGWPAGAQLNSIVETLIARHDRKAANP
jgi:4-carboxymuconolactone decarboxylase